MSPPGTGFPVRGKPLEEADARPKMACSNSCRTDLQSVPLIPDGLQIRATGIGRFSNARLPPLASFWILLQLILP